MPPAGYTVSSYTTTAAGLVVVEVVTDRLQRLFVAMPPRHTDAATIDAVIRHAIGALTPASRPFR